MMMTIYYGTDKETANRIIAAGCLPKHDDANGPMISTDVNEAVVMALQACEAAHKPRPDARVIIIENVPALLLNTAKKVAGDSVDTFTLNDEFGNPMDKFNFQKAFVVSQREARNWKFYYPNDQKEYLKAL